MEFNSLYNVDDLEDFCFDSDEQKGANMTRKEKMAIILEWEISDLKCAMERKKRELIQLRNCIEMEKNNKPK